MGNFDEDILNSIRDTEPEFEKPDSISYIDKNGDSLESGQTKYLILCFPRTKIEEVEVYLRSRNVDNYDTCFSLNEFSEVISKGKYILYIFDFIGETRFRDILLRNKQNVSDLYIFTNKDNTAELGKTLTSNVFVLSKLMDILTLFWDSDVFQYDNVVSAQENGIELVNRRALEIQGKKLDKLELSFSIEKEKSNKYSPPISYINIEKKFQGKDIGKVKTGNMFKRVVDNFLGKFKEEVFEEEYDESEQLYSDEQMEYMEESKVYKLETDKLTDLLDKMSNSVESSMSEFLLKREVINEDVFRQIEHLKELKQISGLFCEVEYALSLGLIDEIESINLVNDYYHMYCMQCADVLNSIVLLDDFKFEGCMEFRCFCTRGMRRDVKYFVIDPDNEYGKNKIEEMFNNFEYIFTKEKYIVEKLNRMRGDINA